MSTNGHVAAGELIEVGDTVQVYDGQGARWGSTLFTVREVERDSSGTWLHTEALGTGEPLIAKAWGFTKVGKP